MSRRRKALHRSILPDPRFHSTLVTELVGVVLKQGKKTIAEQIVYTALDLLDKKVEGKETPLEKFELCLENIKPRVEVKSRRVGGANYQVPMEVAPDRAKALALRWLLDAARNRNEANMAERLAAELVAAKNSEGNAVRKKNDTHKMAEANKASARRTIRTRWPKPTRLSLTSVSNSCAQAQNYPRGRSATKSRTFSAFCG